MDDEIGDDWDDRARVRRRGDVDALEHYGGGCGREFGRDDDDGGRRRRNVGVRRGYGHAHARVHIQANARVTSVPERGIRR